LTKFFASIKTFDAKKGHLRQKRDIYSHLEISEDILSHFCEFFVDSKKVTILLKGLRFKVPTRGTILVTFQIYGKTKSLS